MDSITVRSPAKINLALDIVRTRPDGYHDIDTIFQAVALFDVITFAKSSAQGVSLRATNSDLDCGESNLILKSARLVYDRHDLHHGLEITIEKHIPIAGGLGGGSSNAAATLFALSQLFEVPLNRADAAVLGADVTFFLDYFSFGTTTMRASGIGEQLTPLTSRTTNRFLLVYPRFDYFAGQKKTPHLYKQYDRRNDRGEHFLRPNINSCVSPEGILDQTKLPEFGANVFEEIAFEEYPRLAQIKSVLKQSGATYTLLSGAGPTVFGSFDDERKRQEAVKTFISNCEVFSVNALEAAPNRRIGNG